MGIVDTQEGVDMSALRAYSFCFHDFHHQFSLRPEGVLTLATRTRFYSMGRMLRLSIFSSLHIFKRKKKCILTQVQSFSIL